MQTTKNIFLIDGAAGTGKSDLLEYIESKYSKPKIAKIIRKFTTRELRPEEKEKKIKLDLKFISYSEYLEISKNHEIFSYEYGGNHYAFYKKDIDNALSEYSNIFIIVRNLPLILKLKEEYKNVKVISVYIHSDKSTILERLEKDGYSEEAKRFRLSRQKLVWDDYLRNPDNYDEIIINNSNKNDFQRLIDNLIMKYNKVPANVIKLTPNQQIYLMPSLVGYKDEMITRLNKYPYEKNIFLMMKFRKKNELVFKFISKTIEEKGFNCVRADQKEWNITNNVHNPIAVLHCCKYGIALFDKPEEGNNFSPNVAYELGMMHLMKKNCLILRHSSLPSMPFDLIKDLHKEYDEDLQLEEIVKSWLDQLERG